MKPYLLLRAAELRAELPYAGADAVHFTEALAASVIEDATRPGDLVLDPFAGYGTTLAVASRLGRQAVGIELLDDHLAIARDRVPDPVRLIRGDARRLTEVLGGVLTEPIDLVLTSPPYMTAVSHPENPLTGYASDDGDYATYLDELADVFRQVVPLLRPGGRVVLNVANLAVHDHVTPLAWDVGRAVSRHLTFLGETFLCWDEHPRGFAGDYLLWFARP